MEEKSKMAPASGLTQENRVRQARHGTEGFLTFATVIWLYLGKNTQVGQASVAAMMVDRIFVADGRAIVRFLDR